MRRRTFISTTLSVAGGSMLSGLGQQQPSSLAVYDPPEDELVRVSIFHTTDLHGHIRPTVSYTGDLQVGGLARCASQIREWRKASEHHLTLDIGDLYQGTHVSRSTQGELMVRLLNAINYDAWVAGNHDFDWGEAVFQRAVDQSNMSVLSSNLIADGFAAGHHHHQAGPYANLLPMMIKPVGGINIGIFGITTPGLPFWLNPGQLGSIQAADPLAASQAAIAELKNRGAHCIIAAGHMGLRHNDRDDYANQVHRIIKHCPEIDVYIAGHTHRDRPSTMIGNTLLTQAGYHGIWAGKLDLTFLKDGTKLIQRDAHTYLMNNRVKLDPVVMSLAEKDIAISEDTLATEVGTLADQLSTGKVYKTGADVQGLIAAAIIHTLNKRGAPVDGVLHGAFSSDPINSGKKTLADLWEIIPFENRIVTATLTGQQLFAIAQEAYDIGRGRKLVGFRLVTKKHPQTREYELVSVKDRKGQIIDPSKTYRIAFNSYDAQSGGRRLLHLREALQKASSKTIYHSGDTRTALADYFLDHETVREADITKISG